MTQGCPPESGRPGPAEPVRVTIGQWAAASQAAPPGGALGQGGVRACHADGQRPPRPGAH